MEEEGLLRDLLPLTTAAACRDLLTARQAVVPLRVIEELKAQVDELKLRDPRRAAEVAAVALAATSFSPDPAAVPLALWAQGNALLALGDFPACAESYSAAEAAYAAQGDLLAVGRLQTNRVFVLTNLGRTDEALALAAAARTTLVAAGQSEGLYQAVLEMNTGVACRQAGRYEEALAAYARGRGLFERLGNVVQVARMDINRAKVLEKLDRFREAVPLVEAARAVLQANGIAVDVARADMLLAHLAFRRGRYRESLELYGQACDGFAALGEDIEVAAAGFYQAQVYLALNLFAEAGVLAGGARAAFAARGMERYVLQALALEAAAARGQQDLDRAHTLLEQARAGLAERGEEVEAALLDLQRAVLLRLRGQAILALEVAHAARGCLERHGLVVSAAQADVIAADSLLDLGRGAEAQPLYIGVRRLAENQGLAALVCRAAFGLGRVAEQQGAPAAAAAHYEAALAHVETIHGELRLDEFQAAFLDDKLDIYEAAVRLALRRGALEEAFLLVERAKSAALLDLLARGSDLPSAVEAAWLARVEELREEWHWHARQARALDPEDPPAQERSAAAQRWTVLRAVEHRLSEAWRQARLRDSPTGWPRARRLEAGQVAGRLAADTALLEFFAVDGRLVIFVVSRRGLEVVPLAATAAEVERMISFWRFDMDSLRLLRSGPRPAIPLAAVSDSRLQLQRLYRQLLAPIADRLEAFDHLVVVPHQALFHLPLAALHDGERYLAERFETSYLPGASLLVAAAAPAGPAAGADLCPLVLGHSDDGRLPYALEEARRVAASLPGADLLLEGAATWAELRRRSPGCSLLHLAAHGAFRVDNPFFSWLRLADGDLTVRDAYGLRLDAAALVTLSACETGLGGLRGGDVLGLSLAFLGAGARSLLLSLWAVDDRTTADLMAAFYRHLAAGRPAATALGLAQQRVREERPHPFYWAGFVLVGAGRAPGPAADSDAPAP